MRYLIIILLLALVLITSGCTTTTPAVTPQMTITIAATPTPEPTLTRPLTGMDPIIGSWDNGMIFNADGTVGSDRNVTWKANTMVENSYFVTAATGQIYDRKAGSKVDPTVSSAEWIYNPASDTIHIRDTIIAARRVLHVPATATPAPAGK
jgi:hypothetical protein